ncbi:TetR/AcrR family transcriptional regulator [Marinomonas epiphytica]
MRSQTKFDREDVIQKATHLYWEKGFHGTSMRTLQDVIDMRPGSIYAAFGSKEGLFKESLNYYLQQGIKELHRSLANAKSPLRGVKQFVRQLVICDDGSQPNNICMLTKTIGELTEENAELLEVAKAALKKMENEFANALAKAQQQGELEPSQDCDELARFLQIQIAGMRMYARLNNDPTPLAKMIEEIFAQFSISKPS